MVVRGVPHRIAKDAWWLDDCDPPKGLRAWPLLIITLVGADLLFWGVAGGIGFAFWVVLAAIAIYMTVWREVGLRDAALPFAILVLGVLPLIEVVQFATVMIAILALLVFGVLLVSRQSDLSKVLRAVLRLPGLGFLRNVHDALAMRVAVPDKGSMKGVLFDWAFPAVVGSVFVFLLVAANPLLDRWAFSFISFDANILPEIERVFFWIFIALVSWPLLRLSVMQSGLFQPATRKIRPIQSAFINARSVTRALVMFNLIFALQTALDLGYLWGGFALPEGMTYANYAHRGAYPLLATALLAGLFALMAQPYLGEGQGLRRLLYLWVAQTMLLVLSSILRLDLYVEVYGLTRLRFAAFVWMGVVAGGLGLIIMQMFGRHTVGWFLGRAFGLGLFAFYVCCLVNIDGLIARHNLASGFDDYYVCTLSEGAAVAVRAHEVKTGVNICDNRYRQPYVSTPVDWREWGYRNARLRSSLAALEE